ncbi:MAG: hypothetical protein ABIR77_08685, partial [Sphingomicrobium sp.]
MTSAFITLAAAASLSAQGATPAPTANTPVSGKSTYVDLDGSVGYSTNPNLAFGNATGRAFVRVSARAVHTRFSVRSNTSLSAYGENVTYLGRYGSQQIFSLGAHHDTAISEKVRLFGDLTGSLDRSGLLGTRFGPLNTVDLSAPTIFLPSLPDAQGGFVTAAGRTYSLGAQLGAQIAVSAVDSVTVRGGANHIMLRGTSFDNSYNILLASMAYDRRLNARTSIGEVVSVQSTDYDGPSSVLVITPQATARMSLSDNTDISGAVGVSFATVKNGLVTRRSTGLAFSGSLCHRGESDQLCASVARDQQTS